jgi:DNA polymerase-3 subunit beta
MIRKVLFAVSKDETRPALNGILWHVADDGLSLVATDGHRLAKVHRNDIKIQGMQKDLIIPPKVLENLIKLTHDDTDEIGLILNENSIVFVLEDSIITSRLLEGPYPNYEQVIPKDNNKNLLVEKDILQSSVRRVSILSNTLTHQVKFAIKQDKLELSATNFDFGGEAREDMKVAYKDEEMDIGYNANYVIDILKQIDDEEVRFELNNPTTAAIVKPEQASENEEVLFLVMPLRLME